MNNITFTTVLPDAKVILPEEGDMGVDLVAAMDPLYVKNEKGALMYIEYDTGVVIEPADGFFAMAVPRSSLSNKFLGLTNSVGIIDPSYRGTVKCRFSYTGRHHPFPAHKEVYDKGDKIIQIVILPNFLPLVSLSIQSGNLDDLQNTKRGTGGFGSTGS